MKTFQATASSQQDRLLTVSRPVVRLVNPQAILRRGRRGAARSEFKAVRGSLNGLSNADTRNVERASVLNLISESVEINALVQQFEVLAGRSAMVGFLVASVAELAVPRQGLFGAWDAHSFNAFVAVAGALIATSAVLAAMSKRRLGQGLQGAVLTSLTALSGVGEGIEKNVDQVFEQAFGGEWLKNLVDLDYDDFL